MIDPNNASETADTGDFMAGFNSDDDAAAATTEKIGDGEAGEAAGTTNTEGATTTAEAGEGNGEGNGEGGTATGTENTEGATAGSVDNSQNGEQVPGQQAPALDLSSLPDDVRQLIERERSEAAITAENLAKTQRDFQALHGKLAPTQRELDTLRRQQQASTSAQGAAGDAGSAASELAEAEAYYDSPAFLDYAKTWPEEAKLLKEGQLRILRASLNRANQLEQRINTQILPALQSLQTTHQQTEHERATSALAAEHSDWQEINQSDEFWDWFGKEEPYLNFTDEQHRDRRLRDQTFVAHLLTRYKRETGYAAATQGQGQPANQQQQQQPPQQQQQQTRQGNARLAMAGAEVKGGAGIVRQGSAGVSPGDQFQAGFNSPDS